MSTATRQRAVALGARPERRRRTPALGIVLLLVALLVLAAASVTLGARDVSMPDVLAALGGADDTVGQAAVRRRIPRTLVALLVGGALGTAGTVLQSVTRNPLADAHLMGITPGASLAVVVGITFFGLGSPTGYAFAAILGAAAAATGVYAVASTGPGGATPLKLALSGAAIAAATSALVSVVLLPRVQVMASFRFWQVGGVGGADLTRAGQIAPFLVVGALLCLLSSRGLNALALGPEVAAGLGFDVVRTRAVSIAGAVVLCGAATALAGPIGFVGLIVPAACRHLVGLDHRWLLPCSALGGAALIMLADVVGRVALRPTEIDVGVITALIGAPVFVAVVRRHRLRAL